MHDDILIGNSTQLHRIIHKAILEHGIVDGSTAYRVIYRNLKDLIYKNHYIGNRKYVLNGVERLIERFFGEV